jgi:hypothetical protein
MSKLKIKLVFLGHQLYSLNTDRILSWKSDLFEIVKPIDSYTITENADGPDWHFTDDNILEQLPKTFDGDFLIAVTNVPIENNYYVRRFKGNKLCLTYFEMKGILESDNIPLENLILRAMYSASLVFKRYGNRIPLMSEHLNYTHDETRGCLFDMNGIKTEIVHSTNKPRICDSCVQALTTARVEKNLIDKIQTELKKIKKETYYRVVDFIKVYPIWTLLISSVTAIILGTIGSLIASWIWEKF